LPSESGASQVGLAQVGYAFGRHGTGKPLEPAVRGSARRQRYLLLEDDLHERPEPRRPVPERWRAVARDDRGKVRVPSRKLGDAYGEGVEVQLRLHLYLTSSAPAM